MLLNHITLTTGHIRRSPRSEVAEQVIHDIRAWLDEMLEHQGQRRPMLYVGDEGYTATIVADIGLSCTIYAPDSGGQAVPLATFSIARPSDANADEIWSILTENFPTQSGLRQPATPWCAVAINMNGLALHPDANEWIGDFERCLAWAWIPDPQGQAEKDTWKQQPPEPLPTPHTHREHLAHLGRLFPQLWKNADKARANFVKMKGAPNWCFLPIPGWSAALGKKEPVDIQDASFMVTSAICAGLGAWRPTQGVYRFDPELYKVLIDTPMDRDIPIEVLHRLPAWCVYVETPGLVYQETGRKKDIQGAWIHLDWGHNTGQTKFRVVMHADDIIIPIGCPLSGTIEKSITNAVHESALALGDHGVPIDGLREGINCLRDVLAPLLSLALYLCSEEADIPAAARSGYPAPKRTKDGPRNFPADQARVWTVGERIGAVLRQAQRQQESDREGLPGTGKRPHIRRAHWHTYWAGKKRSEQRIKWLPPIAVKVDSLDDLPTTIIPVKSEQTGY